MVLRVFSEGISEVSEGCFLRVSENKFFSLYFLVYKKGKLGKNRLSTIERQTCM